MSPYADTNFLARAYLELPDSLEADHLLQTAKSGGSAALPLTWLHRVEVINAFQLQVFVARDPGQSFVTPEKAALAHANFISDIQSGEFFRPVTLSMSEVEQQFEELSLRHTAKHGFRAYDLLHVVSALILNCDTFWSFDSKASKLASLEGLQVRR